MTERYKRETENEMPDYSGAAKRRVHFKGLCINQVCFPCFNHCRFCIIGRKRTNNIKFNDVVTLVDRFRKWNGDRQLNGYRVFVNFFRAYNQEIGEIDEICGVARRLDEMIPELCMGGIKFMSDDDLKVWLQERRDIGMDQIRLSLAGTRALHDSWVGRQGDFDFNLRAAKLACEMGYGRNEWLFISRSTIPLLGDLVRMLDEIPGRRYRGFRIMNWARSEKLASQERLTKEEYASIPEWIYRDIQFKDEVKSEREWLEEIRCWPDRDDAREYYLIMNLEDNMMSSLMDVSCDDIVSDLEARSRAVYDALPVMKDLGLRYGNEKNNQIFHRGEIERSWIKRFVDDKGLSLEQGLTWLY